ncbi:MAG: hypothetical protein UT86_C0004G0107 [Candidatus Magasanikbacteria bacterium GW2011_GWC2_40_17]|uniref:Baseplate protein J-like domain-containing protein n=1 Tax=Candidatus Magasanikbacteria bacterium GW2011_GWA2_42_32 TaxID=1619039 RepID=A0A0G1A7Z7_9BACT|nr:MAG: hypothetical protein UT86_C0004G0107 [Candidatus Magasanikbacteria bacterium GW2011_GWC2_40_17]KKS57165.1 MAG: hypothetical protein UV20_C0003G0107 [Candidatus Magasanikbacteria bacterium GW2011_GWA2_42_32]OGH85315.1 MAG: hypothetical protein A2294_00900 [Candidatus Magasanikbacteria bacterium RIFOXYB2_FULL_38_10]
MPPRKTITARPRKKKIISEPLINVPPELEEEFFSKAPIIIPQDFNPSPRFYRTIALTFLGVALVLILGVLYFTLGKAEISLSLKPKNVKADFLLGVVPQNPGPNQINGMVLQKNIKNEKFVAVTDEGEGTPSQATGRVTIYNQTNQDRTLIATTRLLSPNNILFRMKKTLVIPARGQAESDVYSDKVGVENEIGPTEFTIPGLSTELQKVIFAENKEKMTGGLKFIKTITDDDIKTAGETLIKELAVQAQDELKQTSTSTVNFDNAVWQVSSQSYKSAAKLGEAADSFKIAGEVVVIGVFYNSQSLNKILSEQLRAALSENEVVVGKPDLPVISLNKFDLKARTAELKVAQDALAQVSYLEDVIDKSKILGQKKSIVEEYLRSLPWIEKAVVKLSPAWILSVPKEMSRVKIKIDQ